MSIQRFESAEEGKAYENKLDSDRSLLATLNS